MMKHILSIAASEWQYWRRSKLVLGGAFIFLALYIATSLLTIAHIDAENHARTHQQNEAEETFLAQPDRHPHRMVHYGHYLFRAPAPLALFDPGLDAVTGQSIFLEGHRQNTAMFAESAASADFGGLSWLTPALIYQLFAPLIIILLGHGAIVRERESSTLAPLLALGVSSRTLIAGKTLALFSFTGLLLIPLLISCFITVFNGESFMTLLSLAMVYCLYLAVWAVLTILISSLLHKRTSVLATLTGLWFGFSLVLPSMAVNFASDAIPLAGKIETDMSMQEDLRKAGDSHNTSDPAFKKFRADLLEKYDVEVIEDLPINYRGMVAMQGEKNLTKVLNEYADKRMDAERLQEIHLTQYAWLTPTLAITFASRSIAGTDLAHYHRFQKEAETVRFDFVQGLNSAHVEQLSYQDDINRNKDKESSLRARVDASNWQVLGTFQFKTATLSERLATTNISILILLSWLILTSVMLMWSSRRIKP